MARIRSEGIARIQSEDITRTQRKGIARIQRKGIARIQRERELHRTFQTQGGHRAVPSVERSDNEHYVWIEAGHIILHFDVL